MCPGWRLIARHEILREKVIGRDIGAENGDEKQEQHQQHAQQGELVGNQPVKGILGQTELLFFLLQIKRVVRHYSSPVFLAAARGSSSG